MARDARRRSVRGRYTYAADKGDSGNIRAATRVLTWLDEQHLTLATLSQADLDGWALGNSTLRAGSIPFIQWAGARGLTTALTIAHPPNRPPSHFQVDDIQHEELRQRLVAEFAVHPGCWRVVHGGCRVRPVETASHLDAYGDVPTRLRSSSR
ncbi:hypothetical protein ACQEUX_12610 [Micromonospora sp. CA-259024]|uniref:hypothetical protein n=1 Tax=Micromonospora sp. CA-259024 TaxID=3239965 RepID=UPI003D9018D3